MAAEDDLRRRLALTGLSYADWEQESVELRRAADLATIGGFVDGKHLVRAGEIVEVINAEIAMLDELAPSVAGEVAGQLAGVRDRLTALRTSIQEAARQMHGMTEQRSALPMTRLEAERRIDAAKEALRGWMDAALLGDLAGPPQEYLTLAASEASVLRQLAEQHSETQEEVAAVIERIDAFTATLRQQMN